MMKRNKMTAAFLAVSVLLGTAACSEGDAVPTNGNEASGVETTAIETYGIETSSVETSGSESVEDMIPVPSTDELLFMCTYYNWAEGYQSELLFITCRGDVYSFENKSDSGCEMTAWNYIKAYTEPVAHIDPDEMTELYNACLKIKPGVKTSEEFFAFDAGERKIIYIDQETSEQTVICLWGTSIMTTDDAALQKAGDLASDLVNPLRLETRGRYILDASPDHIVNIPYGGSELIGKQLVFENYQQFKSFCQDNGIDTGTYIDDEMKNSLKYSRGILFEVFDTNARAGGVLNENEKTLAFLPSLDEFEYDPAFDGKVTAAVYPLAVNTSWTIESYYEG